MYYIFGEDLVAERSKRVRAARGVDASANTSKLENLGEFTAVKSEYEDDRFPLMTGGGVGGGRWIVRARREGTVVPAIRY